MAWLGQGAFAENGKIDCKVERFKGISSSLSVENEELFRGLVSKAFFGVIVVEANGKVQVVENEIDFSKYKDAKIYYAVRFLDTLILTEARTQLAAEGTEKAIMIDREWNMSISCSTSGFSAK